MKKILLALGVGLIVTFGALSAFHCGSHSSSGPPKALVEKELLTQMHETEK